MLLKKKLSILVILYSLILAEQQVLEEDVEDVI